MHYHLEIIMPPTDDIERSVEEILREYSENYEDEEGEENPHAFWDFYVIGGRWAAVKITQKFEGKKLDEFHKALDAMKLTVSAMQCGKQELKPSNQIPEVDKLWQEHFPEGGKVCPLFNHYNDQYKNTIGFPDIMELEDIPENLHASRVIIAKEHWQDKDKLEIGFMIEDSYWNGINHIDSNWKGGVLDAVKMWKGQLNGYKEEFKQKNKPQEDWLVVTIDYHT